MMEKFEYFSTSRLTDKEFNRLGAEGWKLITVDNGFAYFMRELKEDELLMEHNDEPPHVHAH